MFTGSSWLDKQPLAAESVKPSLIRRFLFFGNYIDLHHFWPNVQDKAFLSQSGETFSHVNLTSILIVDGNLINVQHLLQLGSTFLTASNPSSPSSSPHSPSILGSGSSEPVLNGGLCSAAHCSSAEGRCTPKETVPLWDSGQHWRKETLRLFCVDVYRSSGCFNSSPFSQYSLLVTSHHVSIFDLEINTAVKLHFPALSFYTGTNPNSPISLPKSPTFPSGRGPWSDDCSICYENTVDTVIYACGHMCLCYTCGLKLKKMSNACCPICRRQIKDIIKAYRSTWRRTTSETTSQGSARWALVLLSLSNYWLILLCHLFQCWCFLTVDGDVTARVYNYNFFFFFNLKSIHSLRSQT